MLRILLSWVLIAHYSKPLYALNDVTTITLQTTSNTNAGTDGIVVITLWYNFTIYRYTLDQPKRDKIFINHRDASPVFNIIGSSNCHKHEYNNIPKSQVMIALNDADAVKIAKIKFDTASGEWYGISGYMRDGTKSGSLCVDNDVNNCGPLKQIMHFDTARPNEYISDATWSDGTDVSDTIITCDPTRHPSYPTPKPTLNPTRKPTLNPTTKPTSNPTLNPTSNPTANPTSNPTVNPTTNPSKQPTFDPTINPTFTPTFVPIMMSTVMKRISTENNDYASTDTAQQGLQGTLFTKTQLQVVLIGVIAIVTCMVCLILWLWFHYSKKRKQLQLKSVYRVQVRRKSRWMSDNTRAQFLLVKEDIMMQRLSRNGLKYGYKCQCILIIFVLMDMIPSNPLYRLLKRRSCMKLESLCNIRS
eukprot:492013_1